MKPFFLMTVDMDPPPPSAPNLKIEDGTNALLALFEKHQIKATFFVPGMVAEKFPDIMQQIIKQKQKHEIACHGLTHSPREGTFSVTEQTRRIKLATSLIERATEVRPIGFRAPLFKVNVDCWTALQKNDYIYDSSIVCSLFYGARKVFFPSKPFLLAKSENNKSKSLLEIPISVNPFLPFPLGGAWIRIFGSKWAKVGLKMNFLFRSPAVFYIHPKDVIPRTSGPFWYSYKGTRECLKRVDDVISYVKEAGAIFLKASELADLFLKRQTQQLLYS
jgi:peptidoglycan/xylan/chitin deacetylase (PgdA/CDA1 family)